MNGTMEYILGRAGAGKTEAVLQDISEILKKEAVGKPLLLLVPEHRTYLMERALAARGSFTRAYVMGFRRLAQHVLCAEGKEQARISEVGRRVLLRKAVKREQGKLTILAKASSQRGFTEELSAVFQEMKSYGVSPEIFKETAEHLDDSRLRGKITDLATLAKAFDEEMEGRYNDAEDRMTALAAAIPTAKFADGIEIWADGFLFFNPQECAVLAAFLARGAKLHVTIPMDLPVESKENTRDVGIFSRAYRTMQMLDVLAKDAGANTVVRALKNGGRFQNAALQDIERALFARAFTPMKNATGLCVVEAANQRLEVALVAGDILRLAREEGYRYQDIAVLVRDESYDEIIPQIFADRGIAYFRDGRRAAVHHPLAELLRSVFDILKGWRYEAMLRALRTEFFLFDTSLPLSRDAIDLLENYILAHGVRGEKRWTQEAPWKWKQRRSLEEEEERVTEKEQELLDKIDLLRRKVAEPLVLFEKALKEGNSVRNYAEAVYQFLLRLEVPVRLEEWAKHAEAEEKLAEAAMHRQIWKDIMLLLEQLVETGGADAISPKEFAELMADGLDALTVAIIPPGIDYVTVASFDQNGVENTRAVYILGANEGVMPRRRQMKGLLSDADRLHLSEQKVKLPNAAQDGTFLEKYQLYRAFTLAKDYLCVSYALADADGGGQRPSLYVKKLLRLFPTLEVLSVPLEILSAGDALGAVEKRALTGGGRSVSLLAAALRGRRERGTFPAYFQDVYNWALRDEALSKALKTAKKGLFAHAEAELPPEIARMLYAPEKKLRGSVTRFEIFNSCPFQHFARYGLKLEERKEYGFKHMDLGNLLHEVLRAFGEQMKKEGRRWSDVADAECETMAKELIEKIAPRVEQEILLSRAQYRHQISRIQRTAIFALKRMIAMDRISKFHPEFFERAFGSEGKEPLRYALSDGFRLEVRGKIDRIDKSEDGKYFMLYDYKTGQGAIDIVRVYYGLKLQLLTYILVAKSLSEMKGALPAGMLYQLIKLPQITEEKSLTEAELRAALEKKLKMPGWILADAELIRMLDASSTFIKVKLKNDGSIYANAAESVKTMEEFELLLSYIDALLEETGERILAGEIKAEPYRMGDVSPCAYCDYRVVCGFDVQIQGYAYRDLADKAYAQEQMEERVKEIQNDAEEEQA